ncbi:MAG: hypothetical protein JXR68_13065 [Bacteroidales bacterium]|nr:hypothetical protein [Bacteroidales bacterium]
MYKQGRHSKLILIIGSPRTGKTTLLKKIIENTKRRVLILTKDGIQWEHLPILELKDLHKFQGVYKIFYNKALFQILDTTNFNNCIIVCDDFRNLQVKSTKELDALEAIVARKAHRMNDIIIVAHGFTQIKPKYLYSHNPDFILFKTSDSVNTIKSELLNPQKVIDFQQKINEIAKTKPRYFERFKMD